MSRFRMRTASCDCMSFVMGCSQKFDLSSVCSAPGARLIRKHLCETLSIFKSSTLPIEVWRFSRVNSIRALDLSLLYSANHGGRNAISKQRRGVGPRWSNASSTIFESFFVENRSALSVENCIRMATVTDCRTKLTPDVSRLDSRDSLRLPWPWLSYATVPIALFPSAED